MIFLNVVEFLILIEVVCIFLFIWDCVNFCFVEFICSWWIIDFIIIIVLFIINLKLIVFRFIKLVDMFN